MSHALTTRANGFVEMAFVGETPWHQLGQELTVGASIDQWVTSAGMDWKIQRSKVRYAFAQGQGASDLRVWDDKHVLFRSDSKDPLGLVSPMYKPVQPREVIEFFRDLAQDAGYQLHTAGTIHGGRKMWALAKVAEGRVADDKIGAYLLLSTACDGTQETEARFTTVRVVCNNTLTMARDAKANVKIGHRSKFDAAKVKATLGLAPEKFNAFLDDVQALAGKQVTRAVAENFVRELLRPTPAKTVAPIVPSVADAVAKLVATAASAIDDDSKRAPKGEAEILSLFAGLGRGSQLATARGTAWGLVNAVTEYVDHKQGAKSLDHKLDRAFFGSGEDLKNRAMVAALAL